MSRQRGKRISVDYLVDHKKCFFCGEPIPCDCDASQQEPKPNARPYAYHTDFLTPAEASDYFNRIMEMQSSLGPADTYGRMKQGKLDCSTAYSGYRQSLWIGPEINPGKPVREADKIRFVNGVQHLDRGPLDDLVL